MLVPNVISPANATIGHCMLTSARRGNPLDPGRYQRAYTEPCEPDTQCCAQHGEHEVVSQQLSYEPPRPDPRAERTANSFC